MLRKLTCCLFLTIFIPTFSYSSDFPAEIDSVGAIGNGMFRVFVVDRLNTKNNPTGYIKASLVVALYEKKISENQCAISILFGNNIEVLRTKNQGCSEILKELATLK